MTTRAPLDEIRDLCRARLEPNRPTLVAIDGPGGAGKSTLARALRDLIPRCSIVGADDFYRVSPDRTARSR